jgi:diacylglycerol kinase (CTP)
LSWADTAASTFGRLWGRYTHPLPSRLPLIPFLPAALRSRLSLPLARQKSLAGFIAASLTAGAIAFGFWGWLAPIRRSDAVWKWGDDVLTGWIGLSVLSVVTGLIGGISEALGMSQKCMSYYGCLLTQYLPRSRISR